MVIKQKRFLKSDLIKQEKNGSWMKRIFLLDNGKFMVNVCWTGVDYKPQMYRLVDTEEEAERLFMLISSVKKIHLYLEEDK